MRSIWSLATTFCIAAAATGYYTAIIAHVVGDSGRVTAIELMSCLHLVPRRICVTSATWKSSPAMRRHVTRAEWMRFYVNAGATHPMPLWLDSLQPGGRLIFPMVRYPKGRRIVDS